MDGSGSVGQTDFNTQTQILQQLMDAFDISNSLHRVAYVQFSSSARLEFDYIEDKNDLITAIGNVNYMGGSTYTGAALQFVYDNLISTAGRNNVRQAILVLNDGGSNDEVGSIASNLRNAGIQMFAMGYKGASYSELLEITDNPDTVFMGNLATDLLAFRPELTGQICKI